MNEQRDRPTRLVDVPPDQDAGGLGAYFRSAVAGPGEDTPLVKWRIRSTLQRRVERRNRALRFVLVGALMFAAGGIVGAVVQPFLHDRPAPQVPSGEPVPPTGKHGARRAPRPATPAAATLPEPEAAQDVASPEQTTEALPSAAVPLPQPQPRSHQPATKPIVAPGPRKLAANLAAMPSPEQPQERPAPVAQAPTAVRPPLPSAPSSPTLVPAATPTVAAPAVVAPAPAAVPPPPPPALTRTREPGEQALLAQAMRKLRGAHEPAAALAVLDAYQARYPSGVLAPEAARMRTQALLLLGRKDAALSELDQRRPTAANDDEQLVLRGELRAAAGRWPAALADFDAVLGTYAASADSGDRRTRERWERALWGRASARSQLGDDRGARADLREYLRLFPHGRFAAQATRLLDEPR